MAEPNEQTWIPLTGITSITFRLPGGGSITVENILNTDAGVASILVVPGDKQEATIYPLHGPWPYTGHICLNVYGPFEGEAGHYNPDGSQDKEGMRYDTDPR